MASKSAAQFMLLNGDPLPLKLSLAAELSGFSENYLREQIKAGKLSGKRAGEKGMYVTDTRSFYRWYDGLPNADDAAPKKGKRNAKEGSTTEAAKAQQPRGHQGSTPEREDSVQSPGQRISGLRIS